MTSFGKEVKMIRKICFFTTHYDPARQVLMEYYQRILPKDIEIFVVSLNPIEERYSLKRAKKYIINGNKYLSPIKLRKFLRKNDIDAIANLSGTSEVAFGMFFATVMSKTKYIFYFQGNPRYYFNWFFPISQFFTDRFLACSKEVEEKLKKYLFSSRKKIFYLPNPIDVEKFKPGKMEDARKKLGLDLKDKIIIQVGRIEYDQGSDYLLEAVKRNPDKKFIYIGKVKDDNFEKKRYDNLTLVPFVPHEEIPDYYRAANISIYLTRRSSYPFPQRESISCGTPVIVFDIGAFKVMNTGAVIKSKFDIHDLQRKIDNFFFLSKVERKKISDDGRKFIIKDSSEEMIREEAIKLFLDFDS